MHLLWRLAGRDLRHHPRRHLVGVAGTALAVAVVVTAASSRVATEATLTGAERAVAGSADVVATPLGPVDGRVAPETVDALRALPEVRAVAPVLAFDARLRHADAPGDSDGIRVRIEAPGATGPTAPVRGRLPEGPDEIALPVDTAAREGIAPGDRVRLTARSGTEAVVSGLVGDGDRPVVGGRVPVVAAPALARRLDGDRPGWQSVLVTLDGHTSATDWLHENARRAPPGVVLQRAAALVGDLRTISAAVSAGIDMLAVASVLLGCLLCFHMTRLAAAGTRRQTAVLRAVGATRGDVVGIDAITAAVTGVVGIVAGGLLGRWGAAAVVPLVSRTLDLEATALPTPTGAFVLAAATAGAVTATTVIAGRPWSIPPVAFLTDRPPAHARRWPTVAAAVVLVVAAIAVLRGGGQPAIGVVGAVALIVGAVGTLRGLLVAWGRRRHRPVRPGGAVRALGVRAVAADADLAGISAGLVMATMAVLLAAVIGHRATAAAVDQAIARQFAADVQLATAQALPADAAERIAAVPGVRAATLMGTGQVTVLDAAGDPRPLPVLAVDPGTYFAVSGFDWRAGTPEDVRRALAAGDGIALTRPVADGLGVGLGATVRLQGRDGPVERRVTGVFVSFAGDGMVMGRADAAATFGVTEARRALIAVEPGHGPAVLRALVRSFPDSGATPTVEFRNQARQELLSLFGVGYGALLTAALLCTVGLGASMSASVLRRERELRLLRGAGAGRSQVVRMLAVEATILVGLGFVGALPLGWVLARVLLDAFHRTLGVELTPEAPLAVLAAAPVLVLALAAVATVLPARRAARLALVR